MKSLSLRSLAKQLAAVIARPRKRPDGVVRIFGYHHVFPDVSKLSPGIMPPLCVSTETFAAHMDHLERTHEVLRLADAAAILLGARPLPMRDVAVVTFDDGYPDILEHATPILLERGLPATMFITTGAVTQGHLLHDRLFALVVRARRARMRLLGAVLPDRLVWALARADHALARGDVLVATDALLFSLPIADVRLVADALAARLGEPGPDEISPILGWDGIRELAARGVEIGAHGLTHGHFPLETPLVRELDEPRAAIAAAVGRAPVSIAYPAGRYDVGVLESVRRAGYTIGLTTEDRPNRPGVDLLRLGRKIMSEPHTMGPRGRPFPYLVRAQLGGAFQRLGLSRPVRGDVGPGIPWR
jgi:peptidoglycan/xylan/chitin deacetylase (PgdA/CDA1 family)